MLGFAAALGGCNETTGGPGPIVSAPSGPIGPAAYRLPPGAACTTEITRFQSLIRSDLETGNLEQKVYDEIQRDLTRAAGACEAGRGAEAHAIVTSTRVKHGYRDRS